MFLNVGGILVIENEFYSGYIFGLEIDATLDGNYKEWSMLSR